MTEAQTTQGAEQGAQTVEINSWGDAKRFAAANNSSALDLFFDFATTFDWITPLGSILHMIFCGGVGFSVYDNGTAEWASLYYQLKARGVKVMWRAIRRGVYSFNVPGRQATYAMYWLDIWNLNYRHSRVPKNARQRHGAAGRAGKKHAKRGGSLLTRAAQAVKREMFN